MHVRCFPMALDKKTIWFFRSAAVGLVCLLGAALGTANAAPPWRGASPSLRESGARFAIADFDGDSKADVVTVLSAASSRSSTQYVVELRFGSGVRNWIDVVAPSGGLRLRALDVNGDTQLDLIVTTQWLDEPVTVLLNDGRGNFSKQDPSKFPAAAPVTALWNASVMHPAAECAVLPLRPAGDADAATSWALKAPAGSRSSPWLDVPYWPLRRDGCSSGRSPPHLNTFVS